MKQIFILILILLKANVVFAMEQKTDLLHCDTLYSHLDTLVVRPEFKGGYRAFMQFNRQVAKLPPIRLGTIPAKARVIIEFNVDKQGKAFAPTILRIGRVYFDMEFDKIDRERQKDWDTNIDFDYCKEEAIRILNLAEFIPAKKNGENVCFEKMRIIINVYYAAWR